MARPLFTILTLFPEALESYLDVGILGIARQKGLVEVRLYDFRDWTRDRHRSVDDRPFGGGPGMVLKPEPLSEAIEWIEQQHGPHRRLVLDPAGQPFRQTDAAELSEAERCLFICGRYEGLDERLYQEFELEPFSIGDFVLSGGELPALCLIEAAARLIPGALGDRRSALEDSFQDQDLLDHPHYTRPRSWRGREVPEVLFSGDHARIAAWRRARARERTHDRRPDLAPDPDRTQDSGRTPDSD
jgi:tRNA (guanine37-N1)-methyltransferase